MNKKDKELLSVLYEMEHYKPLVKLMKSVRKDIADLLIGVDMTGDNADKRVSFLQGQHFALKSLESKIKQIHKASTKD